MVSFHEIGFHTSFSLSKILPGLVPKPWVVSIGFSGFNVAITMPSPVITQSSPGLVRKTLAEVGLLFGGRLPGPVALQHPAATVRGCGRGHLVASRGAGRADVPRKHKQQWGNPGGWAVYTC